MTSRIEDMAGMSQSRPTEEAAQQSDGKRGLWG